MGMNMLKFEKCIKYSFLKNTVTVGALLYSVCATIMIIKLQPQVILIGTDENGVRQITQNYDILVKNEKLKLIKKFSHYFYNYDSLNYDDQLTEAGHLMNPELWNQHLQQFEQISKRAKEENMKQEAIVEDIRMIDDYTFEVDTTVQITRKLSKQMIKLRTEIILGSKERMTRVEQNPSIFEVIRYEEKTRDHS